MLTQAASSVYVAHAVTDDAPAPLGGTASGGPIAGIATAHLTAASPLRRAPDRSAIPDDHAGARRGGASAVAGDGAGAALAGTATVRVTAASSVRRASGRLAMADDHAGAVRDHAPAKDAASARPSPACRWRRHGEPGDTCRPPATIARDDPRFARLPYGDGRAVRFGCRAPTPEAMRWATGLLRAAGWRVHRVGAAIAAHHPSGRRWIVGWSVGDHRPPWLDDLPELAPAVAA